MTGWPISVWSRSTPLELVFDLEEKFDIEIPVNANDAQIGGFEKVSDVVAAVQKIIDKKAQSA